MVRHNGELQSLAFSYLLSVIRLIDTILVLPSATPSVHLSCVVILENLPRTWPSSTEVSRLLHCVISLPARLVLDRQDIMDMEFEVTNKRADEYAPIFSFCAYLYKYTDQ